MLSLFGYIAFTEAVFNIDGTSSEPFFWIVGIFVVPIAGMMLGCLISYIFAARVLKIEKAEIENEILFYTKSVSGEYLLGGFYRWCVKVAYEKNS